MGKISYYLLGGTNLCKNDRIYNICRFRQMLRTNIHGITLENQLWIISGQQ